VKALSGGERNRLLLARLLTRPANVLILDEPTNDLDIETLELVEAELVAFPGTLLIVSHDRRFLNNVVTSTLVFEGDGRVREYVGGYDDWLQQRDGSTPVAPIPPPAPRVAPAPGPSRTPKAKAPAVTKAPKAPKPLETAAPPKPRLVKAKLSYKEQLEFDALPARIQALEKEQAQLQAAVAAPDFYKEPADAIAKTLDRTAAVESELDTVLQRWDALDSRTR
jgi:ATP-binding cassette subfamily F protein uup